MIELVVLMTFIAALSWRHRRRSEHTPRLLLMLMRFGERRHGPTCGCEACLENYAELAIDPEACSVADS